MYTKEMDSLMIKNCFYGLERVMSFGTEHMSSDRLGKMAKELLEITKEGRDCIERLVALRKEVEEKKKKVKAQEQKDAKIKREEDKRNKAIKHAEKCRRVGIEESAIINAKTKSVKKMIGKWNFVTVGKSDFTGEQDIKLTRLFDRETGKDLPYTKTAESSNDCVLLKILLNKSDDEMQFSGFRYRYMSKEGKCVNGDWRLEWNGEYEYNETEKHYRHGWAIETDHLPTEKRQALFDKIMTNRTESSFELFIESTRERASAPIFNALYNAVRQITNDIEIPIFAIDTINRALEAQA